MPLIKVAIGGLCFAIAVSAAAMQLHLLGPHGPTARAVHLLVAASALLVGLRWLVGSWPSHATAVAFVVWADFSLATEAALSSPVSWLCTTVCIYMGLIGVFAAVMLGVRVLSAHCVFATATIGMVTGVGVVVDHVPWFDLCIFLVPALSLVVALPILIQVLVGGGRRFAQSIFRDALHDPMTGIYNRRGMYSAAARLGSTPAATIVGAAVIDVDRFKKLNDTHGHERGDAALQLLANALQSCTRSGDIVARVGGDEFAVIAAFNTVADMNSFIARIHAALESVADILTVSVGTAWQPAGAVAESGVDALLRSADTAMYHAKRLGGNRIKQAHLRVDHQASAAPPVNNSAEPALAHSPDAASNPPTMKGRRGSQLHSNSAIRICKIRRW